MRFDIGVIRMNRRRRIAIYFCGGCNPRINRDEIAGQLIRSLSRDYTVLFNTNRADYIVYLCGCAAGCSWKKRDDSIPGVCVAGEMVDGWFVSKPEIIADIIRKIKDFFGGTAES